MSITYTTLRQSIKDWMENDSTEFDNVLDTIIMLGEIRLMRDVNILVFRKTSEMSLTIGDPFVPKPCDFVTPRFFFIYGTDGNRIPLLLKDTSLLSEYWSDRSNDRGTPKYYANWDHDTFIIAPTPDLAYTAELGYTTRPASFTSAGFATTTTGDTWLSINAPDALLYVCLLEASKFLKENRPNVTTIQMWEQSYKEALERLRAEEHFEVNTDDLRDTSLRRQENIVPADK